MYSAETKEQTIALRSNGWSLNEIAAHMNIAKGTLSLWLRDVEISDEGRERLRKRLRMGPEALAKHVNKRFRVAREEAYARGLASALSLHDAFCVGLYWGEGSKYDRTWKFVNSDRAIVAEMIKWAIQAGQPAGAFRAVVQIHPEDTVSEDNIRNYWSQAGIPPDRIKIFRTRSEASNRRVVGRIPFGTCRIAPVRNAATLFEYYRGQRDQLLAATHPT